MELPQQQPRTVLTEEEYTETLSSIIQRDFFPQLPELERQAAILERRAAHDFPGAVAVRRAARRLQQHEQALADQEAIEEQQGDAEGVGFDNDGVVSDNTLRLRRTARPLHRESVTGFHARVTNVDNAEFDQQQREELQAARKHLEQVFRNKHYDNVLRITSGGDQQQLMMQPPSTPLLASDAFNASPHRATAAEWKPPEAQNGLFFVPSTKDKKTNSASTATPTLLLTNHNSNHSMPPPPPKRRRQEATLSFPTTSSSLQIHHSSQSPERHLVEYIPKHALEKKIEPSRTRFPSTLSVSNPALSQLHTLATSIANSSNDEYSTDASNSTDLDAAPRSLDQERRARDKRQRLQQERLVAMTPLLAPGRDGVAASPIMTWGTVSSTPLVLGGAAAATAVEESNLIGTSQQFFALPAPSERDQRAAKAQVILANQARQRLSSSSSQLRNSSQAKSTSKSHLTTNLTPAARSLLEKMSGGSSGLRSALSSTPRSRDAFGTALRASYNGGNPTPKRPHANSSSSSKLRSSSRPKDTRTTAGQLTKSATAPTSFEAAVQSTSRKNPTDGLLKLNVE